MKRTPVSAKKEKENKQENNEEINSPEKLSAQRLGVALRNLLKLPKGKISNHFVLAKISFYEKDEKCTFFCIQWCGIKMQQS